MTAARIGISEAEFWQMLPREFLRRIAVFEERRKEEAEKERDRFYHTLNAFGMVMAGKRWKWQSPHGPNPVENFDEREARALKRHHERHRRKAA